MTASTETGVGEQQGGRLAAVRDSAGQTIGSVKAGVSEAYDSAKDGVSHGYEAARDGVSDAYETVRDRAGDAYATAREKAQHAGKATIQGIEQNPVVALVGGLALGALAGALLPRTQKEAELLAPLGSRLNEGARAAASAAKEAGVAKLGELGLDKDSARTQVDSLIGKVGEVASTAGGAAAQAVRKPGV